MSPWIFLIHLVHDYIVLILAGGAVILFVGFWFVLKGIRNTAGKDEVFRLRQRLYALERERNIEGLLTGPLVMTARWVPVGSAATTSDGGCLLLVERCSPLQKSVLMTVRVDGLPVYKSTTVVVSQRLQIDGKSGIYNIELSGAEEQGARLAVTLTNRHLAALEGEA